MAACHLRRSGLRAGDAVSGELGAGGDVELGEDVGKAGVLSCAMAAGFITSLLVYVSLPVQATSAAGQSPETATHHSQSTVSAHD